MPNKPDLQLVTDSRNGDREAIGELFRRHYPSSIKIARRILPVGDEHSDAVQSAYLSAYRNFKSFRAESSFGTWITRIVMNHSLMLVRNSARKKRFVSLDSSAEGSGPIIIRDTRPTPEDVAQRAEVKKTLEDAAVRLPRSLRETYDLCAVSGLSIAETAKALGLTIPATKTRLFRAREHLRSVLERMRQPPNRKAA